MSKKILSFIATSIIFFSAYNLNAEEQIVFVDLNYIFSNSKTGKKIYKEIQTKEKKITKELQDFQKKLDEEKKDLLAQKNVLAENEYKTKIVELESNLIKYNKIMSQKNKDLIDFQNKSKLEFSKNLKSTLEKYATENSISVILRKENLLIGKKNLDITKEILDLFNKS